MDLRASKVGVAWDLRASKVGVAWDVYKVVITPTDCFLSISSPLHIRSL